MSVTKIILSVIVIAYGSNASLLDELASNANKRSIGIGPYYDTMGDYYVAEPIMDTYDQEPSIVDLDYTDNNDWDNDGGDRRFEQINGGDRGGDGEQGDNGDIMERQLPESGQIRLSPEKKSSVTCKLIKVKVDLKEPGYEFFPKSYIEYDCVPHSSHYGSSENSIFSSDTCEVRDVKCRPLQKPFVYFKWPISVKPLCSPHKMERTVKVGCDCIHHVKYHFQ